MPTARQRRCVPVPGSPAHVRLSTSRGPMRRAQNGSALLPVPRLGLPAATWSFLYLENFNRLIRATNSSREPDQPISIVSSSPSVRLRCRAITGLLHFETSSTSSKKKTSGSRTACRTRSADRHVALAPDDAVLCGPERSARSRLGPRARRSARTRSARPPASRLNDGVDHLDRGVRATRTLLRNRRELLRRARRLQLDGATRDGRVTGIYDTATRTRSTRTTSAITRSAAVEHSSILRRACPAELRLRHYAGISQHAGHGAGIPRDLIIQWAESYNFRHRSASRVPLSIGDRLPLHDQRPPRRPSNMRQRDRCWLRAALYAIRIAFSGAGPGNQPRP